MPTPSPSPRTFTPHELTSLTQGAYSALSPADRLSFDEALVNLWVANTAKQSLADFNRDWDRVASNRRFEIGE